MIDFKDIPNYDGIYKIDKLGNIKSLQRKKHIILKPRKNSNGYLYVNLCKDKKYRSLMVHKLMAMTYFDHVPNYKHDIVVDHINNIKTDNSIDNLQLITQRENTVKRVLKKKTSKYTGVIKCHTKWRATITINRKTIVIGRFDTEEEARDAYINNIPKK